MGTEKKGLSSLISNIQCSTTYLQVGSNEGGGGRAIILYKVDILF